jgi:hypothetical protein
VKVAENSRVWRSFFGLANDLAHLRDKTHVEHAVGFVQHHHLDHVQVHVAALVEVQQTARGGDQDVAVPRFQVLELFVEVHAAHERHDVEAGVLGQVGGVLGDLYHQLPGRGDDQGSRFTHVALFGRRGLQQLGDDRDQERSGLAGTGLGAADGVFAGQGEAQYLCLDRRAVREAQVLDGVHQFRGQLEVVKARLALLGLNHEVFQLPRLYHRFWRAFAARLFHTRGFFCGLGGDGCRDSRLYGRRFWRGNRRCSARLFTVVAAA